METLPRHAVRWSKRVETPGEAVRFLDLVGFCLLFPVKDLPLPSLYYAVARREPFAWDRAAEKIWEWKDNLPRQRRAFYAQCFRGRGAFISKKMLPHFLAMHHSAVTPDSYEHLYSEGRLSADGRAIWEALARHGPLATLELRHACRMEDSAGSRRFKKAMRELQSSLFVVHFGAEQETPAWASARFELTCRAFPAETVAARRLASPEARSAIAAKISAWHPEPATPFLRRLWGWSETEATEALKRRASAFRAYR